MELKVISYNCQSVRSNYEIISKLLNECDILFLQETFLTDVNKDILDTINVDFSSAQTPAIRKSDQFFGRASGGLAILWRKSCKIKTFPIYCNERIMAIKLIMGESSYLLFNVYMNCDYGTNESLIEYKNSMAQLANFINAEAYDDIIIAGDFNCDPVKSRFFKELKSLCAIFDLRISSLNNLPADSFTFISRNQICGTSWLDHIISSNSARVKNLSILYNLTFEDHIPIKFTFNVPDVDLNNELFDIYPLNSANSNILWNKATESQIKEYTENLEGLSMNFSYSSLICNKVHCNNRGHIEQIKNQFDEILNFVSISSDHLPRNVPRQHKMVTGWNDNCKALYEKARSAFLNWVINGRVRYGDLFEQMKTSRSMFRKALKFCKNNETRLKRQKFIRLFQFGDKKQFWKELRKSNPKKNIGTIDGVSDTDKIIDIFSNKFRIKRQISEGQEQICYVNNANDNVFLPDLNLDDAIASLNEGQGLDLVYAKHLKLSGPLFRKQLKMLFLQFIKHSFVPTKMLSGEIRPILKNDRICRSNSDNYRPIMNSSVFLKTFEYSLLPILSRNLNLNDLQMGFRENTSCINTVMYLKEIISKYNKANSNVHCAFLDLSKAFDLVDHGILVKKLRKTGLSSPIVSTLEFMLNNSDIHVSLNNKTGNAWRSEIGTRQGGVLSPLLFNFYVKECIDLVSKYNEGCFLGSTRCNVLTYADDIVLIAPSASGLQKLVGIIEESVKKHKLRINIEKSKYIIFKYRKNSILNCAIKLNEVPLERVYQYKYLGIMLNDCLNNMNDVERATDSFLKQFNALYYKFNFASLNVLSFLFKTYSSSFYGIELWYNDKNRKNIMNKISVAYHKAIKKLLNMNVWDSNHLACELLGVNLFRHLQAKRMFNYYRSVLRSKNRVLNKLKYYWHFYSDIKINIERVFKCDYDVEDVFDNFYNAILSRIDFIERNEPRSSYLNVVF